MDPEPAIPASRFKAQCLAILDKVERSRAPVVVTKHGRPVARLVPIDAPEHRDTQGSVELIVREDEAYYGTGENWDVDGSRE